MDISRKEFLRKASILTVGFSSFGPLLASISKTVNHTPYNNLIKDLDGIIDLPKNFTYKIISKFNDKMSDKLRVPNNADGMGCFKWDKDRVVLVRNHEIGHFPIAQNMFGKKNPYGRYLKKYIKNNKIKFYDFEDQTTECFGGTTTILYNTKTSKVEDQYLSLSGTLVNCSGGQTPWNTWISCEETVKKSNGKINKDHGFNFEVNPFQSSDLNSPIPLKEMGRFRHEAVAFDPDNGFVYQTEDREDGLFYRFIPNEKGNLKKGGKLQGLSLKKFRGPDCSNWKSNNFKVGDKHEVRWLNLENVYLHDDDLRIRGKAQGCATFTRGEGVWFGDDFVYFTCTNGGKNKHGQIWRYKHNNFDSSSGFLELFYESNDKNLLNMPDNITISPWGDLIVSEDGKGHDRLIGIKPDGETYLLAENRFNKSEFAGAVFSPFGNELFVNIYKPTMTIAISGDWNTL